MKQKWYFTFLGKHPQHKCYVVIEGTYEEAREEMIRRYNTEWGFQYSESEWIINKKDNPGDFVNMCITFGLDPNAESYTQAEMFGLIQID